jgi:hypothetical protein
MTTHAVTALPQNMQKNNASEYRMAGPIVKFSGKPSKDMAQNLPVSLIAIHFQLTLYHHFTQFVQCAQKQ